MEVVLGAMEVGVLDNEVLHAADHGGARHVGAQLEVEPGQSVANQQDVQQPDRVLGFSCAVVRALER